MARHAVDAESGFAIAGLLKTHLALESVRLQYTARTFLCQELCTVFAAFSSEQTGCLLCRLGPAILRLIASRRSLAIKDHAKAASVLFVVGVANELANVDVL
jgi:hypothetical protein